MGVPAHVTGAAARYIVFETVTTLPVPSGAQVGDTVIIVFVASGYTLADDPRITRAGTTFTWTGVLTSLDDFTVITTETGYAAWAITTLHAAPLIAAPPTAAGTSATFTLPSVAASTTIATVGSSFGIIDGDADVADHTQIVASPTGKSHAYIGYWTGTPPSPTSDVFLTGGSPGWWTAVVPIKIRSHAPPQRITPREDALRSGSPRIYPPPRTYQAGSRVVGGYW